MYKLKKTRYKEVHNSIVYEYERFDTKTQAKKHSRVYSEYTSIISNKKNYWVKYYVGVELSEYHGTWYRLLRTTNERKSWFDYEQQMKENGLCVRRRRRSANALPNTWDDYHCSYHKEHEKSWKCHTKCRKQWMKNLG